MICSEGTTSTSLPKNTTIRTDTRIWDYLSTSAPSSNCLTQTRRSVTHVALNKITNKSKEIHYKIQNFPSHRCLKDWAFLRNELNVPEISKYSELSTRPKGEGGNIGTLRG